MCRKWGATVGNAVYVSRSGLGVTADGALVYVGGPGLNITDLANLLVRAGAVRSGMELDINVDWVNYSYYTPSTPTDWRRRPRTQGTRQCHDRDACSLFRIVVGTRLHHDVGEYAD